MSTNVLVQDLSKLNASRYVTCYEKNFIGAGYLFRSSYGMKPNALVLSVGLPYEQQPYGDLH